jgi:DNA primase
MALSLRDFLPRHGLKSWPKTSGGKGLHIMVLVEGRHFS